MKLQVWLKNYPTITETSPFTILNVINCEVKHLSAESKIEDLDYVITLPRKLLSFKEFKQVPNCNYKMSYTLLDNFSGETLAVDSGVYLSPDDQK